MGLYWDMEKRMETTNYIVFWVLGQGDLASTLITTITEVTI